MISVPAIAVAVVFILFIGWLRSGKSDPPTSLTDIVNSTPRPKESNVLTASQLREEEDWYDVY